MATTCNESTVTQVGGCMTLAAFCPRLSQAKTLLPLLRNAIGGAALRHSLPGNVDVELLPIVADGLFGYELVPSRTTHTYLTIGFCASGEAVLRRTLCSADAPGALCLVTVNGKTVSRGACDLCNFGQQRDSPFAEISDAAEAGLVQLVALFPEEPRGPIVLDVNVHRYLDEALAIAYTHLSKWDPFIQFFGFPNEPNYGLALTGSRSEHGELVSRRPDMWVLRWKSPEADIYEEWDIVLPDFVGMDLLPRAS
jgi:hypothetical protein